MPFITNLKNPRRTSRADERVESFIYLTLTEAAGTSDRGEISGIGTLPTGDVHAYLLIPVTTRFGGSEVCRIMVSPLRPLISPSAFWVWAETAVLNASTITKRVATEAILSKFYRAIRPFSYPWSSI